MSLSRAPAPRDRHHREWVTKPRNRPRDEPSILVPRVRLCCWLAGWRDSPPFTRDRCGDMEDEPEVVREKTRAERDAELRSEAVDLEDL